jgi:hypothetical protein
MKSGADVSTLSDLLLEARMLDYAGMKNLYAAEMADIWQRLGAHAKPAQVGYCLETEFSATITATSRTSWIAADLQQAYRDAWLESSLLIGLVQSSVNGTANSNIGGVS